MSIAWAVALDAHGEAIATLTKITQILHLEKITQILHLDKIGDYCEHEELLQHFLQR
ncbi:MAG: hypothetical protein V7L00_01525 [Nostoc sp.]|uniref:hypothetical protein n=1 Tax=Nostoc sp. TaxID=1180 RepID=UPI002FFAA7BD